MRSGKNVNIQLDIQIKANGSAQHFQAPCETRFEEGCGYNLISSFLIVVSTAAQTSFGFNAGSFQFFPFVNHLCKECITAVKLLFVDVHLNLEKPWKDWPMGNKLLITETCSYEILSWKIICKIWLKISKNFSDFWKFRLLEPNRCQLVTFELQR